jgi:hypothetical protein
MNFLNTENNCKQKLNNKLPKKRAERDIQPLII